MPLSRSEIMSRIRSVSDMERAAKQLAEELAGCRLSHQPAGLIGRPDYANKSRKVAVFVHGCFWHQPCPRRCSRLPKTNREFWRGKFDRNRRRHKEVENCLTREGWKVHVLWEHQVRSRRGRRT